MLLPIPWHQHIHMDMLRGLLHVKLRGGCVRRHGGHGEDWVVCDCKGVMTFTSCKDTEGDRTLVCISGTSWMGNTCGGGGEAVERDLG